jgi:hypothetical protein
VGVGSVQAGGIVRTGCKVTLIFHKSSADVSKY